MKKNNIIHKKHRDFLNELNFKILLKKEQENQKKLSSSQNQS